jgi:Protein of unknown function (DUF3102)
MPDQADSSSLEGATPLQDTSILAEHAAVIRRLQRRVIADVVEIGRRLCECKALVGHGHWLPWLKREFDLSERTARNFINAYKLVETNPATVADLQIEVSALYLLAQPSVSEKVRAEVLSAAASRPVSRAEVKAMLVPSPAKRHITVDDAVDGLGLREFMNLPSAEKAKILDEKPERLEFAIQDAHIRHKWPRSFRAIQCALDELETVEKMPIGKIVSAIPEEHVPAVVVRLERCREFCDKVVERLSCAETEGKRPADETLELSRLLREARRKSGLRSPVQLLESVWPDLRATQIETLRSGLCGEVMKAAAERLASNAASR